VFNAAALFAFAALVCLSAIRPPRGPKRARRRGEARVVLVDEEGEEGEDEDGGRGGRGRSRTTKDLRPPYMRGQTGSQRQLQVLGWAGRDSFGSESGMSGYSVQNSVQSDEVVVGASGSGSKP
jgi:hypothetical protein